MLSAPFANVKSTARLVQAKTTRQTWHPLTERSCRTQRDVHRHNPSFELISYHDLVAASHRKTCVAQPCVNGDRLSQWRMAKFDPLQIRNPSTDRHKIWNGWWSLQDNPLCKFLCKSVHWWLLGKWVKYNEGFSNLYVCHFCWRTYKSYRPTDFHARWLTRRGLTQGVPF